MSQFFYLQSQVVNSQDVSLFSQPSISIANSQSFSITSSQHSISSTTSNRRLTDIKSVSSTQKCCFLCKNKDERKSIPKSALKQVWQEKNIFLPHHNRTCSSHLINGKFTENALAQIVATKSGVLLSDDEIGKWIITEGAIQFIRPDGLVHLSDNGGIISCEFDASWNPKLSAFRPGEIMKVIGKIGPVQIGYTPIYLQPCELRN